MTDQELQDLRDLMAEVMGWIWSEEFQMWCDPNERDLEGRLTHATPDELPLIGDDPDDQEQTPFRPDLPNGQIELLIDRMRELGFRLFLNHGKGVNTEGQKAQALFWPMKEVNWSSHTNRRIAIMLAIKAAKEAEEAVI